MTTLSTEQHKLAMKVVPAALEWRFRHPEVKVGTAINSLRFWFGRWWKLGLSLLCAAAAGATIGRMFPPFVVVEPFWRQFLSGPPVAGLFALGGAGIAYGAAWLGLVLERRARQRNGKNGGTVRNGH